MASTPTPAAAMDEGMEMMNMIKMAGNGRFMIDLLDWEVGTEKEEIEKKRFCLVEGTSSVTDKFLVFFWPAETEETHVLL